MIANSENPACNQPEQWLRCDSVKANKEILHIEDIAGFAVYLSVGEKDYSMEPISIHVFQ